MLTKYREYLEQHHLQYIITLVLLSWFFLGLVFVWSLSIECFDALKYAYRETKRSTRDLKNTIRLQWWKHKNG